jgi:hypothetical protein
MVLNFRFKDLNFSFRFKFKVCFKFMVNSFRVMFKVFDCWFFQVGLINLQQNHVIF